MHEEDNKLAAYRSKLEMRDAQNIRDHDFRTKKLDRNTWLLGLILLVALAGVGVGLYMLVVADRNIIGSNVLIASFMTILYILGGRSPFGRD